MSVQPVPYPDAKPISVQGRPALGEGLEQHLAALSAMLDRLADRVVLFRYRDWVFVSFGLFGALGAVLTTGLMGAILVGQGVSPGLFLGMALLGSAAVVGGSWLLGQAFDYHLLLEDPRKALRRPVFVSWGGVVGLALTLVLFASLSGPGLLTLLDALARSIFLGHAVGRIGCLAYGCCYGRPTRGPLAITYRNPQAKAVRVGHRHGVPLHPAALYEAAFELALLVAVNAIALYGAPLGAPTALAAVGYGCIRFAVEFSRDQADRAVIGSLSLNHLIALALVGFGAGIAALALPGGLGVAPAVSWSTSLSAAPWLASASLPGALVIFVGFSLHRGGVGRW
jgi:phosphatidylglycerol:prolipoprotein diacylglycerol transferase